jgi:hypothetical protein
MTDTTKPIAPSSTTDRPPRIIKLFTPVIGGVIVILVAVATNPYLQNFVLGWWKPLLIVASIILVFFTIVVLMPSGRRWLNESKPTTRAGFFIFVILPLLVLVVSSAAVLPPGLQIPALGVVFLTVVCLLPAAMWYLFLATRKASLLNEFLANLDRLGLLGKATNEDDASRGRRVQSYLQKFEAIYGDLSQEIHTDVLQNKIGQYSKVTSGVTTLSTATVPVMLSTILIALGWLMILQDMVSALKLEGKDRPIQFAFLGAYFFSLQMLFRRYVLNDLGGSAYVAVAIRIILAVIGTWVLIFVNVLEPNHLLVAAFVFGVFPRVIWQVIASIFKKVAGIVVPSMISQLPVSDLDGLTVWHEARLEEEDIENIPNMATADLVELFLNTRLPPERIIDWVDQAILYTQLGPQEQKKGEISARDKLRMHGIRTATSLLRVSDEFRGARESFDKILMDMTGNSVMPALIASLTTNSNLKLIQLWRGTPSRDAVQMLIKPEVTGLQSSKERAAQVA